MQIEIITLFKEMFSALEAGIVGRALKNGLLTVNFWNPRDYTDDPHHTVDDRPYGGGPGMVLMPEPLQKTIYEARKASEPHAKVVYLTPQGKPLTQSMIREVAKQNSLIFVAGRYEGIDERIIESDIDEEWSIGDYVLSGGEFAIMVIIDCITRLLPGALGDARSAEQDSFFEGLLDYPHYTRPAVLNGAKVPEVLLTGNHKNITQWRMKEALGRTWLRRPDLLEKLSFTKEQEVLLNEFIKAYTELKHE